MLTQGGKEHPLAADNCPTGGKTGPFQTKQEKRGSHGQAAGKEERQPSLPVDGAIEIRHINGKVALSQPDSSGRGRE